MILKTKTKNKTKQNKIKNNNKKKKKKHTHPPHTQKERETQLISRSEITCAEDSQKYMSDIRAKECLDSNLTKC